MKKVIFTTAIMLTIGLASASANANDNVNDQVTKSFHKDFVTAKEVKWQKETNYIKATFTMYGQVMFAYYNESGELIGVVRNILSDKLPINLMTELKRSYNDRWISDLFEMASEGQSTYYVTLETADDTLVLKSNGLSGWSVYKRTKKSNS